MKSEKFCLRCKAIELEILSSSAGINFYRCPQCSREFAEKPGRSLTERWGGPISSALYGIIYSARPQDDVPRIATMLRSQGTPEEVARIINEIREEIAHPTQNVRDILDLPHSEEDLREFLIMLVDALSKMLEA